MHDRQRVRRVLGEQVQPAHVRAQRPEGVDEVLPHLVVGRAQGDLDRTDRAQHGGELVAQPRRPVVLRVETRDQLSRKGVPQGVRRRLAPQPLGGADQGIRQVVAAHPAELAECRADLGGGTERGAGDRGHRGGGEERHHTVRRGAAQARLGRPDPGPHAGSGTPQ